MCSINTDVTENDNCTKEEHEARAGPELLPPSPDPPDILSGAVTGWLTSALLTLGRRTTALPIFHNGGMLKAVFPADTIRRLEKDDGAVIIAGAKA